MEELKKTLRHHWGLILWCVTYAEYVFLFLPWANRHFGIKSEGDGAGSPWVLVIGVILFFSGWWVPCLVRLTRNLELKQIASQRALVFAPIAGLAAVALFMAGESEPLGVAGSLALSTWTIWAMMVGMFAAWVTAIVSLNLRSRALV